MKKMIRQSYVVFRKGKYGHREVQAIADTSGKVPPGATPIKKDFAVVGSSLISGYQIPYRSRGVSKGPILGLLQSWNGESRIRNALASLSVVCDQIVCLDDGSTDGTASVMKSFKKVSKIIRRPVQKEPWSHPEPLTRNMLLRASDEIRPAYCVSLDDDEEFEDPSSVRLIILQMSCPAIRFGLVELWDSSNQCRAGPNPLRLRAWRWAMGQCVRAKRLHCGSGPQIFDAWEIPELRIIHWGTLNLSDRLRKFEMYKKIDHDARLNGMRYRDQWLNGKAKPFRRIANRRSPTL